MAESIPGRFRVCISDRSIHDAALELSAALTEGGEPLLILDASGCFQPSHISRCAPHSAGLLHVVRTTASQPVREALGTLETLGDIWSRFLAVQRDLQARQILVVGVLDRLYDPEILTRDAARTLGGIKYKLEQLAKDGFDVTVICENPTGNLGTRAHFLSSLCASADQVSNPRSN
ncbi:MAG TPA: hypothetical protein VFO86_06660 [Terriglobia bacterium]|nr:hypothetical protein [Terriglobia bacterium]